MTDTNSPAQKRQQKERALFAYLVAAMRTGDRRAATQLYRLATPRLLAHANRLLRDGDAARDVAQEAWLAILRGLPNLRDAAAFMPWALQIVSRLVARLIKTRQRDRAGMQSWANEVEDTAPASADNLGEDALVRAAITTLSPAHRATVALFYLEELSVAEVAIAMDGPVGTVKTRLMHARARLRAKLERKSDG